MNSCYLQSFKMTGWRKNIVMTCHPWSPNSIMKSIIRTKRKWLSQNETALKGFLLSLVFYSGCSTFFLIKCGNDTYLSRLLNYTGWYHSNQCRALIQVLGVGVGGPQTNGLFYKPGRWEGWSIFDNQTFQYVFLRGHTLPLLLWKTSIVVFFLFSYNKWALLNNIT